MLIDTHTHIDCIEGISIEEVLNNAAQNDVQKLLVPCAYPKDIDKIYELAQKYDNVYGMLGVHPSEVKDWDDSILDKIREYSKSEKLLQLEKSDLIIIGIKVLTNCKKKFL